MRLLSLFAFLLSLTIHTSAKAQESFFETVNKEIGYSIEKYLYANKAYIADIPSYVKKSNEVAEQITVDFPAEEHNNKIVAQVWVTTNKGLHLLAIPIHFKDNS